MLLVRGDISPALEVGGKPRIDIRFLYSAAVENDLFRMPSFSAL